MIKEKSTKPAKKPFTRAEVKRLYECIEIGHNHLAISLAHAAPGNYKVHKRASWPRTSSTTTYWPMELAIHKKNIEVLKAFLPYVDIFKEDKENGQYQSWFKQAWGGNSLELARLFIKSTADFKDEDGHWLRMAAYDGSPDLLELALPYSDPLAPSENGVTALMMASARWNIDVVERLLPLSDPNAIDNEGKDAVMHALDGIMQDRGSVPSDSMLDLFKLLVGACGIERKDAQGRTAIARLVKKNKYSNGRDEWMSVPSKIVEILLAAGAKPHDDAPSGEGLLMQAINAGKMDLFDTLLKSASLDEADADGNTPLLKAAKLLRSEMVKKLAPISDCSRQDSDGMTALMLAAQNAQLYSVRVLAGRTDRTLRDSKGRTAAVIAAKGVNNRNSERDSILIFLRLFDPNDAKGQGILPHLVSIPELFEAALPFCNPNDQDEDGLTALHKAVLSGNEGAFNTLLPIGDPKIPNVERVTPLMSAIKRNSAAMFNALLTDSDVAAANADGVTALMMAADASSLAMAASLMDGSNANAVDKAGKNALMYACDGWDPNQELVFFLADRSDVSMKDKDGNTAADIAEKAIGSRHNEIVEKLLGKQKARCERGELLSEIAEPKKPATPRKSPSV